MKLKDFINQFGFYFSDDYQTIVEWAKYNGCENELIGIITLLASNIVEKSKKFEFTVKEWSFYALNSLFDKEVEMTFTKAVNLIRLAHLSYSSKDNEAFIKCVDEILVKLNKNKTELSRCNKKKLDINIIKNMHNEIYKRYKEKE